MTNPTHSYLPHNDNNPPSVPDQAVSGTTDSQSTLKDKLKIKTIVDSATENTEEIESRLRTVLQAHNPLLEAAKPLLLILAQMPHDLRGTVAIESFRQLLEKEVVHFQKVCQKANIKREHIITASYCLCTALDEAANSTVWGGSRHANDIGIWPAKLLASTLHSDVDGGTKVFLLISKLIKQPQEHLPLLETLYHILCLGFEGQYATVQNGQQRLEAIRHRVLTVLTSVREPLPRELSPQWKPADVIQFSKLSKLPIWITSAVFGLIVFTLFSWYQYQLMADKKHITAELSGMEETIAQPNTPRKAVRTAALVAPSFAAPETEISNVRQSDQLNRSLEQEIRKGYLMLTEKTNVIHITLRADQTFERNTAVLSEKILAALQKIAVYIQANPAQIKVIGHTDNVSPTTNRDAFSEDRAESVAYALSTQGVQKADMEVTGKGDQAPLINNRTPANRANNRRIDILIMKTSAAEDADEVFAQ